MDEVVRDAPYVTQVDWLDKYNIDFCVHGDDVTTASDGTDCYALVKAAGRYKEVPRTTGVSTTDLVTRMLECTKDHHLKGELDTSSPLILSMSEERKARTGMSKWISSHKIRLFSDGKQPKVTLTLLLFQVSPSHKSDLHAHFMGVPHSLRTRSSTWTEHLIYFMWATLISWRNPDSLETLC